MSKELAENSEYGTDSVPEISDSYAPAIAAEKDASMLYSSGSSIELSGVDTEAETSTSLVEKGMSNSTKTESIRSLWSTADASCIHKNTHSSESSDESLHPGMDSPFIFDGRVIRYNADDGVSYKTPVIFGSRKRRGVEDDNDYCPAHFIFDPRTGTIAAGYDVGNRWAKLPNFSLITGIGNSAELDASFISGAHNHIKLELFPTGAANNDEFCLIPPSCAILGGSHNLILNSSACHYSSAIIGSSNVNIRNGQNVVVLGMRGATGDLPLEDFDEATFARNLYGLSLVHAGPYTSEIVPEGTVLVANGNVVIRGTATIKDLVVEHSNIVLKDRYIAGTGGVTASNFVILPTDNVDVIYVNPINGPVNIHLGTGSNSIFPANKTITIKDVTLEFAPASANNVVVHVPSGHPVRIEHFNPDGGLTASNDAGYVLNTSGGSVRLQYTRLPVPGSTPTWVILDQFSGNGRVLGSTGVKFISADTKTRAKLLAH